MEITDYNHKIIIRVKTFEIDSQGIVHNSIYLQYLEIGRIEYRRNYGYKILKNGMFNDGLKVVVVHNSIDYKSFAFADDELTIFTRIPWIKSSSFGFEQMIINENTKSVICEGRGVLVNLNLNTNLSELLPEKFVNEIRSFEKNLQIIK
ncbi:MAG TPA: thioesterase family protein [Ignavibacteria bacterium]